MSARFQKGRTRCYAARDRIVPLLEAVAKARATGAAYVAFLANDDDRELMSYAASLVASSQGGVALVMDLRDILTRSAGHRDASGLNLAVPPLATSGFAFPARSLTPTVSGPTPLGSPPCSYFALRFPPASPTRRKSAHEVVKVSRGVPTQWSKWICTLGDADKALLLAFVGVGDDMLWTTDLLKLDHRTVLPSLRAGQLPTCSAFVPSTPSLALSLTAALPLLNLPTTPNSAADESSPESACGSSIPFGVATVAGVKSPMLVLPLADPLVATASVEVASLSVLVLTSSSCSDPPRPCAGCCMPPGAPPPPRSADSPVAGSDVSDGPPGLVSDSDSSDDDVMPVLSNAARRHARLTRRALNSSPVHLALPLSGMPRPEVLPPGGPGVRGGRLRTRNRPERRAAQEAARFERLALGTECAELVRSVAASACARYAADGYAALGVAAATRPLFDAPSVPHSVKVRPVVVDTGACMNLCVYSAAAGVETVRRVAACAVSASTVEVSADGCRGDVGLAAVGATATSLFARSLGADGSALRSGRQS